MRSGKTVEPYAPNIPHRDVEHPERFTVGVLLRFHVHGVGNIEIGAYVEYYERIDLAIGKLVGVD